MTLENVKRLHAHYLSVGNLEAAKELRVPEEPKPEPVRKAKKKRGFKV